MTFAKDNFKSVLQLLVFFLKITFNWALDDDKSCLKVKYWHNKILCISMANFLNIDDSQYSSNIFCFLYNASYTVTALNGVYEI